MGTKYKWKPTYTFQLTFSQKLGIVLYVILILLSVVFFAAGLASESPLASIVGLIVAISLTILVYRQSRKASKIVRILGEKNIEFYDRLSSTDLIYIKKANGLMGIFDCTSEAIVIEPSNTDIIVSETFFIISDSERKWGVYNRKLGKMILPFEYDGISISGSGNIVATQSNTQYVFSPYGSMMN